MSQSSDNQDLVRSPGKVPADLSIVVPLKDAVVFPHAVVPLALFRASSAAAIEEAVSHGRSVVFVLQRDPDVKAPGLADLHEIGTVCKIGRYMTTPDGAHHVVVGGEARVRITELVEGYDFLVARTEKLAEVEDESNEVHALTLYLRERAIETIELTNKTAQGAELIEAVKRIESPAQLADTIVAFMELDTSTKQALLSELDVHARLNAVVEHLSQHLEVLRLTNEIHERTRSNIDSQARERMLREQLDTIRRELGDKSSHETAVEDLQEAIEGADLPEDVRAEAERELARLQRMGEQAAEASMLRDWLECVVDLPWTQREEGNLQIDTAREILDADHHGLDKVKKRILEFLAVRKLNPQGKSPILCLAGPPGVGKTSLGKSVARAMGVKFARIALGGVHNEAEIRGHRRTYIGAMPGNIVRTFRKLGTNNPVILLDEIDKLGNGIQGDPAAALLEVLDPEQNNTFTDNYLGLPFDLSNAFFIATANALEQIPLALRDRLEVIELPGYTAEEKLAIARQYLLPKQLKSNGLQDDHVTIDDNAITQIIERYTREAGVRTLERHLGALCRHAAVLIAADDSSHFKVDDEAIEEVLGTAFYDNEVAMRTGVPGIATGLAWTPVGGDILFIEAAAVPGKGNLQLTGQLGDVMRESAQAALTLIRARANKLGICKRFDELDIHIHVPAGATPKDGPSAGVALYMALLSLLTNQTIRSDVAMTGEISLRGLVMPVGGIKEKCLAALRAGIRTVILPARNRKDLRDVPATAQEQLEFVWVDNVEELPDYALQQTAQAG